MSSFKYPANRQEAEQRQYGRDDPFYGSSEFDPKRCAYEVSDPPWYINSHQCSRKPGHGPDALFCKQHAKMVEKE